MLMFVYKLTLVNFCVVTVLAMWND